ncbi:MAG: hypothetical protein KC506_02875 [Nanoarchaeota archaeon]|nr:hypothetical protein [Nanoarchaeota archaeon]
MATGENMTPNNYAISVIENFYGNLKNLLARDVVRKKIITEKIYVPDATIQFFKLKILRNLT